MGRLGGVRFTRLYPYKKLVIVKVYQGTEKEYKFRFLEKSLCKAAVKILAEKVRVKTLVKNKTVPRVLLTRIEDENKWKSTYLSSERSYKFQNIEEKSTASKKYKNPEKIIRKNVKV